MHVSSEALFNTVLFGQAEWSPLSFHELVTLIYKAILDLFTSYSLTYIHQKVEFNSISFI